MTTQAATIAFICFLFGPAGIAISLQNNCIVYALILLPFAIYAPALAFNGIQEEICTDDFGVQS